VRNIKPSPEYVGLKVLANDGYSERLGVIIDYCEGSHLAGPSNLVRFSRESDPETFPSEAVFGFNDIGIGFKLLLH